MLRAAALWLVAISICIVHAVEFTILASSLDSGVTAGVPFNISWADANGSIMLLLKNATTNATVDLLPVELADATFYIWTPPTSLPNGPYQFEIGDSSPSPVYSDKFSIIGGDQPASTTISSQLSPYTSTPDDSLTISTSSWTGTYQQTWTRTDSSASLQTPPPPPPDCTASCSRNLNGSQVTHTPNAQGVKSTVSAPISTSTSTAAITVVTASNGLPNSAKAAIGAGAAIGGNIIIALVVLTFWQGKQRANIRNASPDDAMMHGGLEDKPVELGVGRPPVRSELG